MNQFQISAFNPNSFIYYSIVITMRKAGRRFWMFVSRWYGSVMCSTCYIMTYQRYWSLQWARDACCSSESPSLWSMRCSQSSAHWSPLSGTQTTDEDKVNLYWNMNVTDVVCGVKECDGYLISTLESCICCFTPHFNWLDEDAEATLAATLHREEERWLSGCLL